AIYGVAFRRIPAISPIQNAILQIKLQIDGLGKVIEEHLNIAAICGSLSLGYLDACATELPGFSVVRTFLRPVDLTSLWINGNPDTPFLWVSTGARVTLARINQGLNLRTVE